MYIKDWLHGYGSVTTEVTIDIIICALFTCYHYYTEQIVNLTLYYGVKKTH